MTKYVYGVGFAWFGMNYVGVCKCWYGNPV